MPTYKLPMPNEQITLKDRAAAVTVITSKMHSDPVAALIVMNRESPYYEIVLLNLADGAVESVEDAFNIIAIVRYWEANL